jgi:hypothetical protein
MRAYRSPATDAETESQHAVEFTWRKSVSAYLDGGSLRRFGGLDVRRLGHEGDFIQRLQNQPEPQAAGEITVPYRGPGGDHIEIRLQADDLRILRRASLSIEPGQ